MKMSLDEIVSSLGITPIVVKNHAGNDALVFVKKPNEGNVLVLMSEAYEDFVKTQFKHHNTDFIKEPPEFKFKDYHGFPKDMREKIPRQTDWSKNNEEETFRKALLLDYAEYDVYDPLVKALANRRPCLLFFSVEAKKGKRKEF